MQLTWATREKPGQRQESERWESSRSTLERAAGPSFCPGAPTTPAMAAETNAQTAASLGEQFDLPQPQLPHPKIKRLDRQAVRQAEPPLTTISFDLVAGYILRDT